MARFRSHPCSVSLVALLAFACGSERPETTVLDLVETFATATVTTELGTLDFGDEAAMPYLVEGFDETIEQDASGQPFVWSTARTSVLGFRLITPRDHTLDLDVRPYGMPAGVPAKPARTLRLRINGHEVETLKLSPERRTYAVELLADWLRAGRNDLEIEYGAVYRPRRYEPGSQDTRDLAVAWYGLRLGTADPDRLDSRRGERAPDADLDTARLILPWGSAADYAFELPAASSLVVDRWRFRGEGRVEVTLQALGDESPTSLAIFGAHDAPERIALPSNDKSGDTSDNTTGLVRLSVRALPVDTASTGSATGSATDSAAGPGAVVLLRPRVLAPARADGDPDATVARSPPIRRGDGTRRPHVLVYLIDTLRADHLGAYGYDKPISPHLDAFAARAALFENAMAQTPWTKPSVASIFTGLWPHAHGANLRSDSLDPAHRTLAEVLRDAGYRTAAFVTNPNVSESFGFDRGFEYFEFQHAIDGFALNTALFDWHDRNADPTRPLFLYVHAFDPHGPYEPPERFRRAFAGDVAATVAKNPRRMINLLDGGYVPVTRDVLDDLIALYDAEIATADHAFAALLEGLAERGMAEEEMVIIVVSDHGEEFHEHGGFRHRRTLHAEVIHIPLIIRLPGPASPRRIAARAQHMDLLPTILDLLALGDDAVVADLEGRSLLPLLEGDAADAPIGLDANRRIFTHFDFDDGLRTAVYDGDDKLMVDLPPRPGAHFPRLFDLVADPGELHDVEAENPVLTAHLTAIMRARLLRSERRSDSPKAIIDAELDERLRSLGYIE